MRGSADAWAELARLQHSVTAAVLAGAEVETVVRSLAEVLSRPVRWHPAPMAGLDGTQPSVLLAATPRRRTRRLVVRVGNGPPGLGYLEARESDRAFTVFDRRVLTYLAPVVGLAVRARTVPAGGEELTRMARLAGAAWEPLLAYDAASRGCLVATLRAYLVHGGRIRATAAALEVHENTVRYRLARVRAVSGIEVASLDSLLAAWLALRAGDRVGVGGGLG